jgi:hypothetical protein
MRRIREVLRLHFEAKLNERQIAKICSIGKGTVRRYLKRIAAAGLSWPLPANLDDATLEHRIFPPPPPAAPGSRPLPDFAVIHKELKSRQNVTLQLLWEACHAPFFTSQEPGERYGGYARNPLDITAPAALNGSRSCRANHSLTSVPQSRITFRSTIGRSSTMEVMALWHHGRQQSTRKAKTSRGPWKSRVPRRLKAHPFP